jgi:signal transduction histidine kinase
MPQQPAPSRPTPESPITEASLQADIAAVVRIDAVPVMLEVICQTTGMGFAAVSRVTTDRWIACSVLDKVNFGLGSGSELEIATTICNEIRDSGKEVVIDHVAEDPLYCEHHTPRIYGLQSYISIPIYRRNKEFFGTLCAIDPRPAQVNNARTINMFRLFAELVAFHLDSQDQMAASDAALLDANEAAALREQFIAVLGHDLRTPLSSISSGAQLLRLAPAQRVPSIVSLIERSVQRMAGLIDDVLDFARGRLGGGLTLRREITQALGQQLEHVVLELRTAWPRSDIRADIALDMPVECDPSRIGQLLSNLLSNAIAHGAPGGVIRVNAGIRDGFLEISVTNQGDPIPEQLRASLFQPFFRGKTTGREGLGLGLYIVAEIARAHNATLSVESDSTGTRFSFRMPALPTLLR